MKRITLRRRLAVVSLAAALAATAGMSFAGMSFAADKPAGQAAAPSDADMMAMVAKYANPGEHHKLLEPMVGTWDTKVSSWMAPGQPPTESTGTSVNSWALGGRFLKQDFDGQFMGKPFSGLGYTGYDNVKQKYVGLWMDTMGTGVMESEADVDATGKVFTGGSDMKDPMSGQMQHVRTVTTILDHDHHMYQMFMNGPDGKEMKVMEINYSRKS